jgi:hypothetical protein
MFSLPFMGRDGEAQPSPGGERQSRNAGARLNTSPPCRRFAPTSLPTSGEGDSAAWPYPTRLSTRALQASRWIRRSSTKPRDR